MFVLPWCQNRRGIQSGLPSWQMLRPLKEAKHGKAAGITVSPLWLKNSHKINVRIYIKLSCITLYKFLAYGAYYEFQVRRKSETMTNIHSFESKEKVVSNEDIWYNRNFLKFNLVKLGRQEWKPAFLFFYLKKENKLYIPFNKG